MMTAGTITMIQPQKHQRSTNISVFCILVNFRSFFLSIKFILLTLSKTYECVSSSSLLPTYVNSPLLFTASSASSSTLAKETLTATVEITTTACPFHNITSASPALFLLPTSTGLASISANTAPTIVGKRPVQTTKASIVVPISVTCKSSPCCCQD